MRRLIASIHSTANNVVTGPSAGDETDFMQWAHPGIEETLENLHDGFAGVDTLLLGRGTYEDLVRTWPGVASWPDASELTLRVGERVNGLPKVVVTGGGTEHLRWGDFAAPTCLVGTDIPEQVAALKSEEGGDILIFGSPGLVESLTDAALIDEYRITVHPVFVGDGRHLFSPHTARADLVLDRVDSFPGGALVVTYSRAPAPDAVEAE